MKRNIHCTTGGVEPLREEAGMMYSRKLYIVTEHYGGKGAKMILNLIG